MLYSMPLPLKLFDCLSDIKHQLEKYGAQFRVMIDHPEQVEGLSKLLEAANRSEEIWSVYLKLDIGSKLVSFFDVSKCLTYS